MNLTLKFDIKLVSLAYLTIINLCSKRVNSIKSEGAETYLKKFKKLYNVSVLK